MRTFETKCPECGKDIELEERRLEGLADHIADCESSAYSDGHDEGMCDARSNDYYSYGEKYERFTETFGRFLEAIKSNAPQGEVEAILSEFCRDDPDMRDVISRHWYKAMAEAML